MTEKIDARIEGAKKGGATWVGNPNKQDIVKEILQQQPLGLDIVFECCGQQEALDQAFDILRPGGHLVIIGTPRTERISFDVDKFKRKELTVRYIRRQNHCVQLAMDLIKSKQINVDFMITHRFELEHTQDGFDLVAGYHDGVIKAMISV
jgi:threonine dehydrogenase-like Zn-dependent dehydrogenase